MSVPLPVAPFFRGGIVNPLSTKYLAIETFSQCDLKNLKAKMDIQKLKTKVKEINVILERQFGIPNREGNESPLDALIHTILSQNTNDTNSGRAYDNLIARFPSWKDVLSADVEEIASVIRVGELAGQKSIRIKELLG